MFRFRRILMIFERPTITGLNSMQGSNRVRLLSTLPPLAGASYPQSPTPTPLCPSTSSTIALLYLTYTMRQLNHQRLYPNQWYPGEIFGNTFIPNHILRNGRVRRPNHGQQSAVTHGYELSCSTMTAPSHNFWSTLFIDYCVFLTEFKLCRLFHKPIQPMHLSQWLKMC